VRQDTKAISIRLRAEKTTEEQVKRLGEALRSAPGECPVSVTIELKDGAEALVAAGRSLRVEVGDAMLSHLERIFGEQVAELR
jgi:hypothetical protein